MGITGDKETGKNLAALLELDIKRKKEKIEEAEEALQQLKVECKELKNMKVEIDEITGKVTQDKGLEELLNESVTNSAKQEKKTVEKYKKAKDSLVEVSTVTKAAESDVEDVKKRLKNPAFKDQKERLKKDLTEKEKNLEEKQAEKSKLDGKAKESKKEKEKAKATVQEMRNLQKRLGKYLKTQNN